MNYAPQGTKNKKQKQQKQRDKGTKEQRNKGKVHSFSVRKVPDCAISEIIPDYEQ
jgi:hypothetical protein